MNKLLSEAIKKYKNNPDDLRKFVQHNCDYTDKEIQKVMACMKNLVPETLDIFNTFMNNCKNFQFSGDIYGDNSPVMQIEPEEFKNFYHIFLEKNQFELKPGQETLECMAFLGYGLKYYPNESIPYIEKLSKYILQLNKNFMDNIVFLFQDCPDFIQDTFKIEVAENPLLDVLNHIKNDDTYKNIKPASEKLSSYLLSKKLSHDLEIKSNIKIKKI